MKYLPLLFVCFTIHFSLAQKTDKFGKVTKEDLTKPASKINPQSPGEIFYYKQDVIIALDESPNGWFKKTSYIHVKLKVYDKDLISDQWLTRKIDLYRSSPSNNDVEKVFGLKAVTYNLEGDKIVETKMKSSDEFYEKLYKYRDRLSFTFPNVRNGSVIEFQYRVESHRLREVGPHYFQADIPVVYSEFQFESPEVMVFKPDIRGQQSGSYTSNTKAVENMRFLNNVYKHVYTNLPALNREPFVFNLNNLRTSVRYEMESFIIPGKVSENYSTTWDEIAKDLSKSERLGKYISGSNNFLDETVNQVIAGKNTDQEKLVAIYQYVKDNITHDDYIGIYAENGLRKVLTDKTGSVAEINLLLTAMLRKAGFTSNPVVLSTVRSGMLNVTFPSLSKLNYLITSVDINGNMYLMDASDKNSWINMLPQRALNYRGFIITEKGAKEINLANNVMSTIKETVNAFIDESGLLSGSYAEVKDKYFAMSDAADIREDVKLFEKEYIEGFTFDVENLKTQDNGKGLLKHSFVFNDVEGVVEKVGSKILFNPLLFISQDKSIFQFETRNYPLEFGSPETHTKIIKIKIPDGYKVESLPAEKQHLMDRDIAVYAYKVVENEGYIEVLSHYQMQYSMLPSEFYKEVKKLYDDIATAESQQVVLVKQ